MILSTSSTPGKYVFDWESSNMADPASSQFQADNEAEKSVAPGSEARNKDDGEVEVCLAGTDEFRKESGRSYRG